MMLSVRSIAWGSAVTMEACFWGGVFVIFLFGMIAYAILSASLEPYVNIQWWIGLFHDILDLSK